MDEAWSAIAAVSGFSSGKEPAIASSGKRPAGQKTDGNAQDSGKKAPEAQKAGQKQKQDAHEFYCIVQFCIGLGVVGNGYKSHIKHNLAVEPAGVDSKLSDHKTGDD